MSHRLPLLDYVRGLAILLMVIYHTCYDLTIYSDFSFSFRKSFFWISFRSIILFLFIFTAGFSFGLSKFESTRHFLSKQKYLFLACFLISIITSYFYWPILSKAIYFGPLHIILLSRLLFYKAKQSNLIMYGTIGTLALSWCIFSGNIFFNVHYLQWLGFYTNEPFSEDLVPMYPWLLIFIIGLFTRRFDKYLIISFCLFAVASLPPSH